MDPVPGSGERRFRRRRWFASLISIRFVSSDICKKKPGEKFSPGASESRGAIPPPECNLNNQTTTVRTDRAETRPGISGSRYDGSSVAPTFVATDQDSTSTADTIANCRDDFHKNGHERQSGQNSADVGSRTVRNPDPGPPIPIERHGSIRPASPRRRLLELNDPARESNWLSPNRGVMDVYAYRREGSSLTGKHGPSTHTRR